MNRGLYSGVAAMDAAERRMETITANLANVGASGFKRQATVNHEFERVLRGQVERQMTTGQRTDFTQGSLRPTGNAFDLALVGKGFFAVETPNGEAYTRDGQFRIDDAGVLQTLEGHQVAWEGGRGTVDPRGGEIVVDAEGQVLQGETAIGRLRIVAFADEQRLTRDGHGYFHAAPRLREVTHEAEVRQGQLEQANVSPVDEMVALINVQRSFESSARILSMIDQTYRRLTTSR